MPKRTKRRVSRTQVPQEPTPRSIEITTKFSKDLRRVQKGALGAKVDGLLKEVVDTLAADAELPAKYADHPMKGIWNDHRDCHIRPDLVLIYRKAGEDTLQLVRLGSHSELGI